MRQEITITQAKEENALEIKVLLSNVWEDTYKNIFPANVIKTITTEWHSIENLRTQIVDDNTVFNIAVHNNHIIGIISAQKLDHKHYLSRLYILSEYQRKGIGKMLLHHLIDTTDIKELVLEVETDNIKAQEFYYKEGFTLLGNNSIVVEQFEIKTLKFSKKININS